MALTGLIQTLSLSGIIQLICNENKTGFLKVRNEKKEFQIYFLKGNIVYAIQTLKEARLGHFLIQDDIIQEEVMDFCLKKAKSKKMSIGKILLEEGYIDFDTLKKYIYKQIFEIFCHLFKWETGEYQFSDSSYNLQWLVVVKLNTLQLVMEALHNIDSSFGQKQKIAESKN